MSTAEIIFEVLKFTLPAGLVLAAVALVIRGNQKKKEAELRYGIYKDTFSEIVPLRLQAYERGVLFLERISPENLMIRVDGRGKTVRQFQAELIADIRREYEHNIAQQLYIKEESWAMLARAKEQTISLINQSVKGLPPDAQGIELGRKVLNKLMESESAPAHDAVRVLKQDIQGMFRF